MNDYLDKYHPNVLSEFENVSHDDTFKLWEKLIKVVKVQNTSFLIVGKLLKEFRDKQLFKQLDYENFTQFLSSEELGFSRESAYRYIRTFEYFIEHLELSIEEVSKMNPGRLYMMLPGLKKIEDKKQVIEQIDKMNGLRHGDFIREIKGKLENGGKPSVYWSDEQESWIVSYHPNITILQSLDDYQKNNTN
jgi:hypothetical protein